MKGDSLSAIYPLRQLLADQNTRWVHIVVQCFLRLPVHQYHGTLVEVRAGDDHVFSVRDSGGYRWPSSSGRIGIDSYIINQHCLRPSGGRVRIAWKAPADGHV